jgi:(E)-4-hydroxy-3-methylbut-2-enyl-diphosphate synthase
MIKRLKTRQIRVGHVKVGGGAPVAIQSMTKVETSNVGAVVSQIRRLKSAGCDIIRVAIKTPEDAQAVSAIKRRVSLPIVCDIHFDHRLALECIAGGADKIRLNPGNIQNAGEIAQVVRAAKKRSIPIRIGVNSGSTSEDFIKSAARYIKLFEELDFHDIIISLKASDVVKTAEAYRRMSKLYDYPLHLGVTASGPYDIGIIKSSIGIGALLLDGIGDTIRVSLTADPVEEVIAAKRILSSLGLRKFGPEILSCPTCGRCRVDLMKIVDAAEREIQAMSDERLKRPITIALMGCEVNGPGEAREADIGIAFGKGSGMLFKRGKIIKKVSVKNAIKELMRNL